MRKITRFLTLFLMILAFSNAVSASDEDTKTSESMVYLKNGNAMRCKVLREDPRSVTVRWQGLDVYLQRSEVERIERPSEDTPGDGIILADTNTSQKWPYQNNPVLMRTNGLAVDGKIVKVEETQVTIRKLIKEGGAVEMDFQKDKIESLLFQAVTNEESAKIEKRLRELFPKMRVHRLGLVTLFTDSEGSSLKTIKNAIQDQMQQIYFNFFEILKDRQPQIQHFVVVFDRLTDYYEYAATDGVPAWLCPGYFSPKEKTLFLVNYGGDQLTEILYQVVLDQREAVDSYAGGLKGQVDQYYHGIIEGEAQEVKNRIQSAITYMTGTFSDVTLTTLRHEITHEFFHDWGLQTIVVSGMTEPDPERIKKKRELLETQDLEKKKELILELLRAKKRENEDAELQINAANSWFVEGTAEFMATTGVGRQNAERLYALQETRRQNELWPLENLTNYRMGSFPGVSTKVALAAYAQSWSFVDFLMKKYPKGFLNYLQKMSRSEPKDFDDLLWLTESVGKDLRELEKEWHAYIDSFEKIEDPQIDQWFRIHQILNSR